MAALYSPILCNWFLSCHSLLNHSRIGWDDFQHIVCSISNRSIYFRSNSRKKHQRDPNAALKRYAIIIIIGLLVFLTLVVIFTRVGRASADSDPFLDPMANPNIRVGADWGLWLLERLIYRQGCDLIHNACSEHWGRCIYLCIFGGVEETWERTIGHDWCTSGNWWN